MIESLLHNVDTLLLLLCAAGALVGAALMLVARQPMRVAIALISTMILLGAIFGLLGFHFIAAFQVLIYVGAVMVFMVFAIMLLEPRGATIRALLEAARAGRRRARGAVRRDRRRHLAAVALARRRIGSGLVRDLGVLDRIPQPGLAAVRADVGAARRGRRRGARGDRHRQEVAPWIGRSS